MTGSPSRMPPDGRTGRLLDAVVAATLTVLPLVGCGVVRLLAGIDVGTGIQPAYVGLLLALGLALGRHGPAGLLSAAGPSWWRRWWLLALAALCFSALGLLTAPAPALPGLQWGRFGRQLLQWLLLAGYPLLLGWWLRGERRWRLVERALLLGLLLELLAAGWQWLAFGDPASPWHRLDRLVTSNPGILCGSSELYLGRHFQGIPRLRGTACEPLYLGNYLLFLLPWLVLAARRRRLLWAAPAVAVLLLLGTWSRGAWLALGPQAAVAVVLLHRAGRRPGRGTLAVAGIAMAAAGGGAVLLAATGRGDWLLLPWRRLLQSFSGEDWSNLTRWYSQQAAWRCFMRSPVWGVGWGQFGYHFPWLVDLRGLQSQFSWPVVNNYYLRVLAEGGLVAAAVFLLAILDTARRTWRTLGEDRSAAGGTEARLRLVAAAAAVAGCWSQLLTFSMVNLPHLWVALGLLVAAWREVVGGVGREPEGDGGGGR